MRYGVRSFPPVLPVREKVMAVISVFAGMPLDLHIPPRELKFQLKCGKPLRPVAVKTKSGNADRFRLGGTGVIARPTGIPFQAGKLNIEPWSLITHKEILSSEKGLNEQDVSGEENVPI